MSSEKVGASKRIGALSLVFCLSLQPLAAAQPTEMFRVKYIGGHPEVAKKHQGNVLFDNERQELVFVTIKDQRKLFAVPYRHITVVSADDKARRRIKETVILGVTLIGVFALPLLLSKKKMRFVLVEYRDPESQSGGALLFRVKRRHKLGMMVATAEKADLERRSEDIFAREGVVVQQEVAEPTQQASSAAASEQAPKPLCVVSVESRPDAADVELDGKFVGTTPLNLRLPPGEYQVTVKKSGFDNWTRQVQVLVDNETKLLAELSIPDPH